MTDEKERKFNVTISVKDLSLRQLNVGTSVSNVTSLDDFNFYPHFIFSAHATVREYSESVEISPALKAGMEKDDDMEALKTYFNTVIKELVEHFKPENGKCEIIFDHDLTPVVFKMGSYSSSNWLVCPEKSPSALNGKQLTVETISKYKSKVAEKSEQSMPFLWSIDGNMFKSFTGWIPEIIGFIVVKYYADEFLPKGSMMGKVSKVTLSRDGFYFMCDYISMSLNQKKPTTHSGSMASIYTTFQGKNLIPLVPLAWHDKEIKEIQITKIRDLIGKYKAAKLRENDDKKSKTKSAPTAKTVKVDTDNFDLEKILKPINAVLSTTSNPVFDISNMGNMETEKLSDLLTNDFFTTVLESIQQFFITDYVVIPDCDIRVNDKSIPRKDIYFGLFISGNLDLLISNHVFSDNVAIANFEEKFDRAFGIPIIITPIADKDKLKDEFKAYLKKEETNE